MRFIPCAILMVALYGCSGQGRLTQPAEELAAATATRYTIVKLSATLGGTPSVGTAINDRAWVAGYSSFADGSRHGVLWRNGSITDLGTLGGPGASSAVVWPGLNDAGVVVGISHTREVDPLNEQWSCEEGAFLPQSNRICRGFVWENGTMRELPPLGGNHSFGTDVNNRGLVVGWAETPVHDPTCSVSAAQKLQFRAALWDPKDGSKGKVKVRELPPLGDDSTSAATAINDERQVVGISGDCDQAVGRYSARHAVLWEKNRKPIEIPHLGGDAWHTPMDINDRADVVGFSNPGPGPDFLPHAFLWTYGAPRSEDLNVLPGDEWSQAFGINSQGQVVGRSCGEVCRAVVWQDGNIIELRSLVDPAFTEGHHLAAARHINDDGQITGNLVELSTGRNLAFVATPITSAP
jgi:probable HAF family extracellular repeat protein